MHYIVQEIVDSRGKEATWSEDICGLTKVGWAILKATELTLREFLEVSVNNPKSLEEVAENYTVLIMKTVCVYVEKFSKNS